VKTKAGVDGKGKEKVAGGKGKRKGKSTEIVDPKESTKTDSPGDKKKVDVEKDAKKPKEGTVDSSDNITPVTTDDATKPVDDAKAIPSAATTNETNNPEIPSVVVDPTISSEAHTTTTDKKATREDVNSATKRQKGEPAVEVKAPKQKEGAEASGQKVDPVVTDEGDLVTPKRTTKELPVSPAKSSKEKPVPALGLTVPKSSKDGTDPLSAGTAAGAGLSPLQKALKDAEDETLMERMARLEIGAPRHQPPQDTVPPPPPHTDLGSEEFECVTAPSGPSTPPSRAARGSFNLVLRSEVPLSDDDDFFLDCDSNASVSNFEGV